MYTINFIQISYITIIIIGFKRRRREPPYFTHHNNRVQYLRLQIGGVVEGWEGVERVQRVQMRVVVEGRVHLGQPLRGRKTAPAWNQRRLRRKAATLVRVVTGAAARFLLVILAPLESLKNRKIRPGFLFYEAEIIFVSHLVNMRIGNDSSRIAATLKYPSIF